MALKTDPVNLARELRASIEALELNRSVYEELCASYHGPAWKGGTAGNERSRYRTHEHEYITLMLGKLVHQEPRFNLSTTRGGRQAVVTRAIERGMNHWAPASKLHEPLEQLAVDSLILFGLGYIEEVPNKRMRLTKEQREGMRGTLRRPRSQATTSPETAEHPYWPSLRRFGFGEAGWDMTAKTESAIRHFWHKTTRDKDDLLREADEDTEGGKWLKSAIEEMPIKTTVGGPERNEVTYYTMWVPDATLNGDDPKSDEHGVLFTLCGEPNDGSRVQAKFIREPHYFYGPPQGPYVKMGFYAVPDSTLPLSPLVATRDQASVLADVKGAMVRRVRKYRKGAIYDLHDKADIDRIEASDDMDLIGVMEFDGNLTPFEVGGITQEDLNHHAFLKEELQTVSGMDDVQRGNVTGQGTATEVAIASEGSQQRVGFQVGKWLAFVADVAQRVGWYAAHDDRIIFSYKIEEDQREEAAQEMLEAKIITPEQAEQVMRYGTMTFAGGDFDERAEGGGDLVFADLSFSIEPYSMQRRDQRTRKMDTLEALNVLSSFGAAAMQGVPIDFGKIADILADVYAIPELEDVVNRPLAQAQQVMGMDERQAAMEKDTASGPGAGGGGGQAKPARSERGGPPKSAPRQTQKAIM